MSFDYARIRDRVSIPLLTRFNQGELAKIAFLTTAGAGVFDAPTTSGVSMTVNGVVSGVSEKFIDGVNITSADLEVTITPTSVSLGDGISIDGNITKVLGVYQIPPAGVAVVTKLIVKGGSVNVGDAGGVGDIIDLIEDTDVIPDLP